MANRFINPISIGLWEYDKKSQNSINYKGFAWQGLEDWGVPAYISQTELDELKALTNIVTHDSYSSDCNGRF
ncbi:hypothetical protein [Gramella sp. AN32]|uniref:Uncharacterized protein n=1 Tax=Christiangramia antarctica TaxID=2058158 RepID=A0ABW5X7U7_9FLAO|nr:hypothetical protein [Gramella sp. AN32]MCM4157890.1 hypothetical protein [Gramella sp. AN32]